MADASQLAQSLRAQLAASIAHQIGNFAAHLALVVQANPQGDITQILDRPDLAHSLRSSLERARAQAVASVYQAWHAAAGPPALPVLAHLLADVRGAYDGAPAQMRQAAADAWQSVPAPEFQVGTDVPGTNPAYQAAVQRAQVVRDAVEAQGQALALRNGLSVDVAASSGQTEATLAGAGPRAGKRWVASMDGMDPKSCAWCRALHGTIVSVGLQFPHPEQLGTHKPPKVYRGVLAGPPLHPNCRCRVELVPAPEMPAPPPLVSATEPGEGFVTSDEIKDMPEERYQSFRSFLRSALHELGQVIRAILGIGG